MVLSSPTCPSVSVPVLGHHLKTHQNQDLLRADIRLSLPGRSLPTSSATTASPSHPPPWPPPRPPPLPSPKSKLSVDTGFAHRVGVATLSRHDAHGPNGRRTRCGSKILNGHINGLVYILALLRSQLQSPVRARQMHASLHPFSHLLANVISAGMESFIMFYVLFARTAPNGSVTAFRVGELSDNESTLGAN
jgi:hypothetical protein